MSEASEVRLYEGEPAPAAAESQSRRSSTPNRLTVTNQVGFMAWLMVLRRVNSCVVIVRRSQAVPPGFKAQVFWPRITAFLQPVSVNQPGCVIIRALGDRSQEGGISHGSHAMAKDDRSSALSQCAMREARFNRQASRWPVPNYGNTAQPRRKTLTPISRDATSPVV
jgi:hypothetical protein